MKPRSSEPTPIVPLLRDKRVILCCGAGGVGKTTTSAALGIAAARMGRRVLVLTIDPARRLCEAMGLPSEGTAAPRPLSSAAALELGIDGGGELQVWMLRPEVVLDNLVSQCAPDQATVDAVLGNRLYRQLCRVTLGIQEYTAAEAIYQLDASDAHDLIILDTPPSRNALDFLDAPEKLSRLFSERLIGLFMPSTSPGFVRGKVANLIAAVFNRTLGEGFFGEMREFLGAISLIFGPFRAHAERVTALLASDAATAVLVTSTDEAALAEAELLRTHAARRNVRCAGYVLNRSWAYTRGLAHPADLTLASDAPDAARAGLKKLCQLADRHQVWARRDRELLARLQRASGGGFSISTPQCGGAIADLAGLGTLAAHLVQPGPSDHEQRAMEN